MVTKILLALGLIVNCVGRYGFNLDIYDKCQALSFLLFLLAGNFNDKTKTTDIAWVSVIFLCLNNLADEFLFDPIGFDNAEKWFAIIIISWTIYRLKKCTNQTSR